VPERIATIVRGIAEACEATGTALIGGETAEHPGVMGADDYDLAGAATGVVERDAMLGPNRVEDGDTVLAMSSSGLHSNGFSLVRHILADRGIAPTDRLGDLGVIGDALLTPTRLYTAPLLRLLDDDPAGGIHAFSHVTGGGIAANLARVLPRGAWVEVDRSTWSPQPVFRVLCDLGGITLAEVEDTWNLGVGFFALVAPAAAGRVSDALATSGIPTWPVGSVSMAPHDLDGFVHGAKGVDGGSVRLVGSYRD
jgi:phosphoribosylformylglycinamidine cyclo-ligase